MKFAPLLLLLFVTNLYSQANGIASVEIIRAPIVSKILNEAREYQVYLPPSYHMSSQNSYPVAYLIDGDYNFHTYTGIIELLSSVSGTIPEMIVVGISDKGNAQYRENCAPNTNDEQSGNANNFMDFIEEELKVEINKKYRTSSFDLILGHSLGGLFTTNFMLQRPEVFDVYIAIDPSLWWNDYTLISEADNILKTRDEWTSKYIATLAETKGMGVQQIIGVLDKYDPAEAHWSFYHYPEENHGSVALPSIKDALTEVFSDWELSRDEFYQLTGPKEVMGHYRELNTKYNTNFSLPAGSLGNIVYFYFRKDQQKDLTIMEQEIKTHFPSSLNEFYEQWARNLVENENYAEAEKQYEKSITFNQNALRSYEGLSKMYVKTGRLSEARKASNKALQLGKELKVRQWLINELQSQVDAIAGQQN